MDSSRIEEVKIDVQWKEINDVPITGPFYTLMSYANEVKEEQKKCQLTVYVQGTLEDVCPLGELKHELVILTLHDVGTNPQNSFIKFVNSPPMAGIKQKAVFLHVCVPGQEPGAKEFVGDFPSMDYMAEFMPQVLDHFGLTQCIGLGEGAGADVLCRFAMNHSDMVRGIVLVHCTSTPHSVFEDLKEIFSQLRIEEGKMTDGAWDILAAHRIGNNDSNTRKQMIERIHAKGLNEHNLSRYLHAFISRTDFTHLVDEDNSNIDAILVTGGRSAQNKNVFHMFDRMDKSRTSLIVAENAIDVLAEAPEFVVHALTLLFQRHIVNDTALQMSESEMDDQQKPSKPALIGRPGEPLLPPAKPALHPEHPAIFTTSNCCCKNEQPMKVPQQKASLLIGVPAALPQDPMDLLPDHASGEALAQKPSDLLSDQLLKIDQPMSKCASSLSQMSNFECPHCGKECCWCKPEPASGALVE